MSDLCERLRIWPAAYGEDAMSSTYVGKMAKDAADEIDRLKAIAIERMDLFKQAANNVERLDAEIASLRAQLAKQSTDLLAMWSDWKVRALKAEAQLARARKAITAGQYYIDQLTTAWMGKPVRYLEEARSSWLTASVDASSLTDEKGTS